MSNWLQSNSEIQAPEDAQGLEEPEDACQTGTRDQGI